MVMSILHTSSLFYHAHQNTKQVNTQNCQNAFCKPKFDCKTAFGAKKSRHHQQKTHRYIRDMPYDTIL